jgi:hypothetical protein
VAIIAVHYVEACLRFRLSSFNIGNRRARISTFEASIVWSLDRGWHETTRINHLVIGQWTGDIETRFHKRVINVSELETHRRL